MKFKGLSKHYLNSVEFEQLEANSQIAYKNWIAKVDNQATKSSRDLYKWFKKLSCRAATKNQGLAVVRTIYNWGIRNGHISMHDNVAAPIKTFRSTTTAPKGYTKEEIDTICYAATSTEELVCARYLKVLFWTGARPQEIMDLRWKDIDYNNNLISIMSAKKREKGVLSRYCNLLPAILTVLQDLYNAEARHDPNGYVFKMPKGMGTRQLKNNYVSHYIGKLCKRADLPRRELRHARVGLATSMLKDGYTITDVQHTLGHKSINTTQRYIRPTAADQAKIFTGL